MKNSENLRSLSLLCPIQSRAANEGYRAVQWIKYCSHYRATRRNWGMVEWGQVREADPPETLGPESLPAPPLDTLPAVTPVSIATG